MAILKEISLRGYMTQAEAASELGVKRQRVWALCEDGTLDGIKVGKTLYPSRASVLRYKKRESRTLHDPRKNQGKMMK